MNFLRAQTYDGGANMDGTYDGCKNYTQNAPKRAFLSSKIEKFSPQIPPPVGRGTPTPYPLGAFGASILAPTALDTRAFGARPPISNRNRRHCVVRCP